MTNKLFFRSITFAILVSLTISSIQTYSQEIVQWRGTNRDGKYTESGLLKSWPESGPLLLWHFNGLGVGHASAAVTDNFVYTAGTLVDTGFVIAFDHMGKEVWRTSYGPEWVENWEGVRVTPTILDGKLYIMSSYGHLFCMDAHLGSILWDLDVMTKYERRNIKWGITENLVIDDGNIYITLGGQEANVIALNKDNGNLVWKCAGKGDKSAYCSPVVISHGGKKILVTMTENNILGIDAKKGTLLWSHEQTNKWSVHANTPLYFNGSIYCVSGYGKGGVLLKLSDDGTSITETWRNSSLDTKMGGVVLLNGKIYGSGDQNPGWYCIDWETGKDLFHSEKIKKGNIIWADDLIYLYGEDGKVALVEPGDTAFNFISMFDVPYGEKQHWAHLVIDSKRLYVRHGSSLMVYSLEKK